MREKIFQIFMNNLWIVPVWQILFLLLFASFGLHKLFLFLFVQKFAPWIYSYSYSQEKYLFADHCHPFHHILLFKVYSPQSHCAIVTVLFTVRYIVLHQILGQKFWQYKVRFGYKRRVGLPLGRTGINGAIPSSFLDLLHIFTQAATLSVVESKIVPVLAVFVNLSIYLYSSKKNLSNSLEWILLV